MKQIKNLIFFIKTVLVKLAKITSPLHFKNSDLLLLNSYHIGSNSFEIVKVKVLKIS